MGECHLYPVGIFLSPLQGSCLVHSRPRAALRLPGVILCRPSGPCLPKRPPATELRRYGAACAFEPRQGRQKTVAIFSQLLTLAALNTSFYPFWRNLSYLPDVRAHPKARCNGMSRKVLNSILYNRLSKFLICASDGRNLQPAQATPPWLPYTPTY
jgi:hypothetical protein